MEPVLSDFAATFKQLVMPRLRQMCIEHGSSVAHGLETFSDAASKVLGAATTLGATRLPGTLFEELEDHLLTTLLNAAVDVETKLWG